MSTQARRPMEYSPDENERAVLDVLREEKRVNPMRVREATDIRKQYVNDALRQLQKAGVVRKVNRGLYEYVPEEDTLPDAPAADSVSWPLDELRDAVRDAREAYEAVDGNGVEEALDRLYDLLDMEPDDE